VLGVPLVGVLAVVVLLAVVAGLLLVVAAVVLGVVEGLVELLVIPAILRGLLVLEPGSAGAPLPPVRPPDAAGAEGEGPTLTMMSSNCSGY